MGPSGISRILAIAVIGIVLLIVVLASLVLGSLHRLSMIPSYRRSRSEPGPLTVSAGGDQGQLDDVNSQAG